MRDPPQMRLLPDGRRLHLQDGPIDLIVEASGASAAVAEAYRAAVAAFTGLLDQLCGELDLLRAPADPNVRRLLGAVARHMENAVAPHAADGFITPMAAVAGSVADAILAAMLARAPLTRAYVNNGGDIAIHCAPGTSLTIGMIDRPDRPSLFGRIALRAGDGVGGIATSGWRGRSFSLGIADSVTVLARSAAAADAAATVIANAVDLPGHPAVVRVAACGLQPDSDLGERLVTRSVGALSRAEIEDALKAGIACAARLRERSLVLGVALQVQGAVRTIGDWPLLPLPREKVADRPDEGTHDIETPLIPAVADLLPRAGEGANGGPSREKVRTYA